MFGAPDRLPVPNSGGADPPRLPTPPGACDCHLHVLDRRFPAGNPSQDVSGMTLDDYRLLQGRLGTSRAVLVQAKFHGTDPAALLHALQRLGPDGRGVAVVRPDIGDAELARLHAGGVRGLRFSVWNPADTVTTVAMIEPLAARVADRGWHVQLHLSGAQIVEHAALLRRLPGTVVIDHMGRLSPTRGPDDPAFAVVADLVQRGRTWVKLSGAYLNTLAGPPYPDATRVARAFVALAPERLVWGSDWPHVTEAHKPDDAELLDLLADWAGHESTRQRILVANPAELYGF